MWPFTGSDRTGEELAVGHVVFAHAGDPVPAGDAEGGVGALSLNPGLLPALDRLGQAAHLHGLAVPRRNGIAVEREAGG